MFLHFSVLLQCWTVLSLLDTHPVCSFRSRGLRAAIGMARRLWLRWLTGACHTWDAIGFGTPPLPPLPHLQVSKCMACRAVHKVCCAGHQPHSLASSKHPKTLCKYLQIVIISHPCCAIGPANSPHVLTRYRVRSSLSWCVSARRR